MKRIIQYISAVAILLFMANSCQDSALDVEDITPTIEEKPWWDGMQLIEDGSRVILPEPVELTVGVSAARVYSPAGLRAVSDLQNVYTDDDKANATVNSFSTDINATELATFDRIVGEDWIRDLIIPELEDEAYSVTGTIPLTNEEFINDEFIKDESHYGDKDKYRKVIIRIYELPTDGTVTFFANSRVFTKFDGNLANNVVNDIGHLSLENPYMFSENPKYQVTEAVIKGYRVTEQNIRTNIGGTRQLFHSAYLPMFGRLTGLSIKDGKTLVTNLGTPEEKEVKTVYLERAVARVKVGWEYTFSKDGQDYTPIRDHIFDGLAPAFYVNVTSIIPNNYGDKNSYSITGFDPKSEDSVVKKYFEFKKQKYENANWQNDGHWVPFYRKRTNAKGWSEEENVTINEALTNKKNGYFYFYIPENFPEKDPWESPWTQEQTVSKLRVFITKFTPGYDPSVNNNYKVDGVRRYSNPELVFGTKTEGQQYRDIRRNHSYNITLRFKAPSYGVQPYIVGTWEDQNVDIPW